MTVRPDDSSPGPGRTAVEAAVRDVIGGVVRAERPSGASLFLDGPPGIGKSYVVRDALAALSPGDATVVVAEGDRRRRNQPFGAVASLLVSAPGGADPADAAFDLVDGLCGDGPVVVWLDDAHHADAASLAVIRRLVWASRDLPLVVVVSARPSGWTDQLQLLVRQIPRHLRLAPMEPAAVDRLVMARTGRRPGPRLQSILAAAAGNPLFALEVVRACDEAGLLIDIDGDGGRVEATSEWLSSVTGLDAMIRDHLAQLSEPATDLLAALAVLGSAAVVADLAELVYSTVDALSPPLAEIEGSGLITRGRDETVGFVHDLYRDVMYAAVDDVTRRGLHRRVGRLLEGRDGPPALVAEHLLAAAAVDEPPEPGLVTAIAEAVATTKRYAPEVTADLLAEVDTQVGLALSGADQRLLERVEALFLSGRGDMAETLIREGVGTVADPAVAAGLFELLTRSLINRGQTDAAIVAIDETRLIDGVPGPAARMLEATRYWVRLLDGHTPTDDEAADALDRFATSGDDAAQASMLVTVACAAHLSGQSDRALDEFARREPLLGGASGFEARSTALMWPAVFALGASGPGAARERIVEARSLTLERDARWIEPFVGFAAGATAFAAGEWDDAVAELDAALERAIETGTGWVSTGIGTRANIDAHRGETASARRRLDDFRISGWPLQFGQDHPRWAELAVLEAEGKLDDAVVVARRVWAAAQPRSGDWAAELAVDIVRIALAAGAYDLAREVVDGLPPDSGVGARLLAGAMVTGQLADLEQARSRLEARGLVRVVAYADEELAVAAAGRDRAGAAAALDRAVAAYEQMGALVDRDRALGRARALGLRRGPRQSHRTADSGWDSLTATENRVAGLLCDGLTNREIGARLFISPRTVQTHVSHILGKTGLRSRVEVAVAARDHDDSARR